ncbi:MAG TPA: alpha/beta hydrolase [Ktedonobacteraceae bacterium]|nr:alpha/beta hydrolase [Ktedonobacteraceae bacterium]
MSTVTTPLPTITQISPTTFHADVEYLENRWQRIPVGAIDLPLIDLGEGRPLVFVPILEHLEFVYARQIRALSQTRRVLLYRRREARTGFVSRSERVEELKQVLESLNIRSADFVAHGDAAMVLFEFALRYPEYCRSLVIVAQGADYRIAPHPFIWLLHELFLRLPIERLVPASFLRRTVIRYIVSAQPLSAIQPPYSPLTELPYALIEEQFCKITQWAAVYRYSVLPVIHSFDIRTHLAELKMPILLINRQDDALSPEKETAYLARHLPDCADYHVIPARERFFLYSQAETVTPLIESFLANHAQDEDVNRAISE